MNKDKGTQIHRGDTQWEINAHFLLSSIILIDIIYVMAMCLCYYNINIFMLYI